MLGYSLLRLGLFVALAIVACTAVGLFTYPVSYTHLTLPTICSV